MNYAPELNFVNDPILNPAHGMPAGSRFRPPCCRKPGERASTWPPQLPDMARRPSGTPRRPDTAGDTLTQDVLCHRAPPRHVHDMVSHRVIFIKAFVLSQRLHLVSIVCDVSVGRRRGLSGACYSACMTQTRRPSTGRESFLPLYLTLFVVYLVGVGLPLGQEQFSSSRAIPGVFRIAAATCGGFLPRNRVETDKGCRHVGRRR